jgi:hypothetical protein
MTLVVCDISLDHVGYSYAPLLNIASPPFQVSSVYLNNNLHFIQWTRGHSPNGIFPLLLFYWVYSINLCKQYIYIINVLSGILNTLMQQTINLHKGNVFYNNASAKTVATRFPGF